MKLGNLSQTIVPVPDFFLNRTTRKIETFSLPSKKQYYREGDLLTKIKDVNVNNNPRAGTRNINQINNEKYLPVYLNPIQMKKYKTVDSFFPHIMDKHKVKPFKNISEYGKFKEYYDKTDINEFLRPKLRDEIKFNILNLLERVNTNYNLKRWNELDSKVSFNKFYQTQYSPISDYLKSNKSVKDDFNTTLKDKALSLRTINNKAKDNILSQTEKMKELAITENKEMNNDEGFDELFNTCKGNLLELKKQNQPPFEYNQEDNKFIKENDHIYKRFNKTTLYRDFASPNRIEFAEKKVKPVKRKYKILEDGNFVSKEGYSFSNMDYLSCQDKIWKRPLHEDHLK